MIEVRFPAGLYLSDRMPGDGDIATQPPPALDSAEWDDWCLALPRAGKPQADGRLLPTSLELDLEARDYRVSFEVRYTVPVEVGTTAYLFWREDGVGDLRNCHPILAVLADSDALLPFTAQHIWRIYEPHTGRFVIDSAHDLEAFSVALLPIETRIV